MSKRKNVLTAMGFDIEVIEVDGKDFLNMSQMAKVKADDDYPVGKVCTMFFSNKNTLRLIEADQLIRNPKFKGSGSTPFKTGRGNEMRITASRLVNDMNANCVVVKKGKHGGIYIQYNLALMFAMWLDPAFAVYVIEDYHRLKNDEFEKRDLEWIQNRDHARYSYNMMCDAIRTQMYSAEAFDKDSYLNAVKSEANALNVIVFKKTAKQWRDENPDKKGNARDYATKEELQLLSYLEVCDAMLIELGWHYNEERMKLIRQRAEDKDVMKSLMEYTSGEDQFIHQKTKYKNPFLKKIVKSFVKRIITGEVEKDDNSEWRDKEGFYVLAPRVSGLFGE